MKPEVSVGECWTIDETTGQAEMSQLVEGQTCVCSSLPTSCSSGCMQFGVDQALMSLCVDGLNAYIQLIVIDFERDFALRDCLLSLSKVCSSLFDLRDTLL